MNNTDSLVQAYLNHLDSIIHLYEGMTVLGEDLSDQDTVRIITRAQSIASKISGAESPYAKEIEDTASTEWHEQYKLARIVGALRGLRDELSEGSLDSLPEHIRGELFDDFLDMAQHLCDEGFKDAAAVIAGGSLEAHLKRLARKSGIDIEISSGVKTQYKKTEVINQELYKAKAYSLFDQKQITAWLDLRNSAAHGSYSNYDSKQVLQFIDWAKDFISRNSA